MASAATHSPRLHDSSISSGLTTPRKRYGDGLSMNSPGRSPGGKGGIPFDLNESIVEPVEETVEKTNHSASLCFAAAVLFMGLAFFEGYRLLTDRNISPLVRGAVWAVVSVIIGTAGEILHRTEKAETRVVPTHESSRTTDLKEGQFPGLPNSGKNFCFINAPTQAIMNDAIYNGTFKSICERAKKRHENYKRFLESVTSQNSFWSRSTEVESLQVENVEDVLLMLAMRKNDYGSAEFQGKYPTIHRLIKEFSTISKTDDIPQVTDVNLGKEFGSMMRDQQIVQSFINERAEITRELEGYEAFIALTEAYEKAVADKVSVVPFKWRLPLRGSSPLDMLAYFIRKGKNEATQEDAGEYLDCLSKYVLPGDHPEIFLSVAYERTWKECPEQDPVKLEELKAKHEAATNPNDELTRIREDLKIVYKPSASIILPLSGVLIEGLNGQDLIDKTFGRESATSHETNYFIDAAGQVKKYELVEAKMLLPEQMPQKLILQLKRHEARTLEKINCAVHMPEEIEVFDHSYQLTAVVVHGGASDKSGHYHAVIQKEEGWWFASDETVDTAIDTDVENAKSYGYLYFYELEEPL